MCAWCTHEWNISQYHVSHGTCLCPTWNTPVSCVNYACTTHGIHLEHVGFMHEICMKFRHQFMHAPYLKNVPNPCMLHACFRNHACNMHKISNSIYDQIWENPPYGIRARFAQCAFLVAKVEICQSPHFVIYVSNNPSSNCCRCLRRLVVLCKGEISLHFGPPSRHSCSTRSSLLWALIGIPASGLSRYTARFIELL